MTRDVFSRRVSPARISAGVEPRQEEQHPMSARNVRDAAGDQQEEQQGEASVRVRLLRGLCQMIRPCLRIGTPILSLPLLQLLGEVFLHAALFLLVRGVVSIDPAQAK